uniref:NPH3 domain-containing protein n=1 Tax=Leersia perrieri TaxID=77586 RepID=A0A0D9WDE3_9ORYZ
MKPPSPPRGGASTTASPRAAVKSPATASSPDTRLTLPSSAAAVLAGVTPPRRSCDDAASCVVNDVDAFARTIATIRSKPPSSSGEQQHLATVLSHYAARWLPDASSPSGRFLLPPQSPTATWIRKRLLLESLVAALPPDDDDESPNSDGGVTCDFLLRLLRAGAMSGADASLLAELESRAARRLDQASLGAVMIPSFRCSGEASGTTSTATATATLLDVALVLRLVRGFLREGGKNGGNGGAAAAGRVARLVDAYLAEAALEAGLRPPEFEELARAVPAHARAADDGLYRAVDTYLKAHPQTGKEERRSLCRLIDARKLSAEAAAHAVQNDRLPVRCVVQVLFSEHNTKLTRLAESSSFRSLQSRSPADLLLSAGGARCPSKREAAAAAAAQQHELRRLREDVSRLQVQCHALQAQVDRIGSSERRRRGLFRWSALLFGGGGGGGVGDDSDSGLERTPLSGKKGVRATATATAAGGSGSTSASGTPAMARWRRSHS